MGGPTTITDRGPAGWTLNAFPVMADLSGRRVLVVGGGHTAEEKIRLLVDAHAHIDVVSPAVTPALEGLARRRSIVWHRRRFRPSDVEGAFFVVAATDDPDVNRIVFATAERKATLCNAVDDTANCSAILPSVHREGPLVVTVSTSGAAPALAVRLREQIARLTAGSGDALEVLAGFRGRIKDSFETFAERRDIWYRIVDSPAVDLARRGEEQRARRVIAHMIDEAAGDPSPADLPVTRADRRILRTLEWSAHPVVTLSGQLGGLVLVDLIRRHRPDIDVVFVDTGYHPPESVAFIKDVARKWDLAIRVVAAETDLVTHEAEHGPLYLTDPARCCEIRKLGPAEIGLTGHDAWFTAIRRDQVESRRDQQGLTDHTLDDGTRLWKVNPLVDWTWDDITAYADTRQIPRHPLYADGYTSIGCAPCTTPTHGEGDDRAGRWSGTERLECGLHIAPIATGRES
jgi:phosphoadenosine phosphosulfate reductase